MFLNKSVKLRLSLSLGLCIVLLIAIGVVGILSTSSVREDLDRTYNHNLITLVDRAADTLGHIAKGVDQVTRLVGEIAVASREQSQGIEQVNLAVSQMDAAIQQNASMVEQSSAASRSLQDQARALLKEMGFFQAADAHSAGTPERLSLPRGSKTQA